ncbi:unnamed protein product [Boreogadus saida]
MPARKAALRCRKTRPVDNASRVRVAAVPCRSRNACGGIPASGGRQVEVGVQPHPASESNQSDSGQVRLCKPAMIHKHSHGSASDVS